MPVPFPVAVHQVLCNPGMSGAICEMKVLKQPDRGMKTAIKCEVAELETVEKKLVAVNTGYLRLPLWRQWEFSD